MKGNIMRKALIYAVLAFGLLSNAPVSHSAPLASNFIELNAADYPKFSPALNSSNKPTVQLLISHDCATCAAAKEQLKRLAAKHPGVQITVVVDDDYFYALPQLQPQLVALSLGNGWIADLPNLNLSDDQLNAFLTDRERFGMKEFKMSTQVKALQRRVDTALIPHARQIAKLTAEIDRLKKPFSPQYSELRQKFDSQHAEWSKQRDALGRQRDYEFDRRKAQAIQQQIDEIDKPEGQREIDYDVQLHKLYADEYKVVGPIEDRIDAIKKSAAGKLLRELKETDIAFGLLWSEDQHRAWAAADHKAQPKN
jgi:hypothetical protein